MLFRVPLVIASLIWTIGDFSRTPMIAGQVRIVAEDFFRCSKEDTINEFMTLVFQFETKRALAFLQKNECGPLTKGELATVDILAPSAEVACIRLQADSRCAWVPTSILR